MQQIRAFFLFLKFHFFKILFTFFATLFFLLALFPFSDLSDVISVQISKATQGQIFVQFETLGISLFPDTGLNLTNLSVETPSFGPLNVDELTFFPSIPGLIFQTPSGRMKLRGILKGDLDVALTSGKKTDLGNSTLNVRLQGQSIVLNDLGRIANLPISFNGQLDLNLSGFAEPTFAEQPEVDVELKIDRLEIPPATLESQMGPISLPDLRISKLELKGRLTGGRFNIEKGTLGAAQDDIFGTIKGGVSLTFQNQGGGINIIPGSYNIESDLTMSSGFEARAKSPLSFVFLLLDNYKSAAANGTRYAFKATGSGPHSPPSLSALR